jgi:hypothetical protein
MQGGQGGQTVDANGMVRRVAYPPQQYVMANGQAVPAGAHRGQGQPGQMAQGPNGQYMNGMMGQGGPQGPNGMMGGQMGGRTGDLDNGMFQVLTLILAIFISYYSCL